VGDLDGNLIGKAEGARPWINDPVYLKGGKPHQTRWVFDEYISQADWDKEKKTEGPSVEGFKNYAHHSRIAGGILFASLCLGLIATVAARR